MQAVHRPEFHALPELECGAPATLGAGETPWPRIGHDRHAFIEVLAAGCGGKLSAGDRTLGRIRPGAHFDFAEELRLAKPPDLRFEPAEAGYSEVRLRFVLTPRVYFHSLRLEGSRLRLTARNTLDNTSDLLFRIELVAAGGAGSVIAERTDNLPPNLERDYEFALPGGLGARDAVRVTLEKAAEALEGGYRFENQVYASK